MPKKYVDRGIVKWGTFDALVGYRPLLDEIKYQRGKKDKPLISEDECEEMNRKLIQAMEKNEEIGIKYYHEGYIRSTFGKVEKAEQEFHRMVISTGEIIEFSNILSIERTK